MRDILITAIILGSLPFIFRRPWIGVLMWTWVGIMNPHRLAWGFAYSLPFAMIVGVATLTALLFSKELKRYPAMPATVLLIVWVLWMTVTTVFAIYPEAAWTQWNKVIKIQLFIVITIMVMQSQERIRWLVWVVMFSIAFYGVKGGVFTLTRGGSGMVLGPDGGFIAGNTEIALAITMIMPLMRYLQVMSEKRWVRYGFTAALVLCAVAVLGSYSRGGVLAIVAMGAALWLKGRQKLLMGILLVALIPMVVAVMPDRWFERMNTISTYEQDSSAMGRINAWWFAVNLAKDRPINGGGFDVFQPELFSRYAPNPADFHDAHSIWFKVLAEHGYLGLILFVALWFAAWRLGAWIIRVSRDRLDLRWASELARMIQVSYVGFWVGGSFLGLSYFDLPYILLALLVLTKTVIQKQMAETVARFPSDAVPAREKEASATA
ncbi:MAG: putative O-glycosylation ligase, exosortase A system-associated [Pseudomonadota bacterium]